VATGAGGGTAFGTVTVTAAGAGMALSTNTGLTAAGVAFGTWAGEAKSAEGNGNCVAV